MMIMGNDGEWMIEHLDPQHLSKIFSIRILNSSALPESKAGRLQQIIDLSDRYPNLFSQEQIVDMLDMPNPQKFFDASTKAVRKAEMEDEMIMSGKKVNEPEEYEFHIEHWNIHVKTLQGQQFEQASEKDKERLKGHVLAHEMFMYSQASKSPTFATRLQELKQFPLLFEPPPPPPMPMGPEGLPQPGGVQSGGQQATSQLGQIEGTQLPEAVEAPGEVPISGEPTLG
jgi:hypothetical protein